ncbi:MAG: CBS domain-containing protein [Gammaproteobacteria bacterium]|nr:CBS domain-containing protein [Gammaproteobacteria bacterium]MBU1480254.1 CBS domain-containing protein [Gammaproteobacteria bacterium]
MSKNFAALTNHPFKAGAGIARPAQVLQQNVTLDDPATSVMTDLRSVAVVNVRAKTTMEKANDKMIRYGVRMLLVMDDEDKVTGLLTATDVLGEKPVRFLQQMGGTHADILVRDVMTVQQELEVLKLEDVQKAKVGNILATLRSSGRQHAMVVEEKADGSQTVRGLYSVTQIARQLGVQVKTAEVAKVFAEIETAISVKQ